MCTRGSNRAAVAGPSTSPLEFMLAISSAPGIRSRFAVILLWAAWITLLWAGISMYSFRHPLLPRLYILELLTVMSGAISCVGGCLSALYVVLAARAWPLVLLGTALRWGISVTSGST